jgi:ABC-type transporter Mla maintaining outer membrane lipid asymmetry ATPase subunit MlaF
VRTGAGKSTLLKVLLGELEPTSGEVIRAPTLRIGRFSQHHVDQLELELSAFEALQKGHAHALPVDIRKHLNGMGLGGSLALQPMRTLSGGQKSRAAFAQIMWQKPHILLLDEPTNHLDIDAVEALVHALDQFEVGIQRSPRCARARAASALRPRAWHAEPFARTRARGTQSLSLGRGHRSFSSRSAPSSFWTVACLIAHASRPVAIAPLPTGANRAACSS